MTESPISAKKTKGRLHTAVSVLVIFLLVCPAFIFPREISDGVLAGIRLAAFGVIPSVFPFLIVADALVALSDGISDGAISRLFSRIFGLPSSSCAAFFTGSVCGFPVGVKVASELYASGALTKSEAERLIGFSNNPSLAFVVSAVGLGIFGSVSVGIALYLSVIISALLVGVLFRKRSSKNDKKHIISRQKFDFVSSVKNAGFSSITISSYIIFFSAVSGLARHIFGDGIVGLLLTALSEVSGGVGAIARSSVIPRVSILPAVAFTLGFSGFSVHLQARSLADRSLSFVKYYVMKLLEGILAALIVLIVTLLFGIISL